METCTGTCAPVNLHQTLLVTFTFFSPSSIWLSASHTWTKVHTCTCAAFKSCTCTHTCMCLHARRHNSPINIRAFVMDVFAVLLWERAETWSSCYKSLACSPSPLSHTHTHARTHTHTHTHTHKYSIGITSWGSHSLTLQQTHNLPFSHIHMCRDYPPPTPSTAWGGEILLPYEEEEHIINYTHILFYTHKHVCMPNFIATHRSQPFMLGQNSEKSCITQQYFCTFLCHLHLDRWH